MTHAQPEQIARENERGMKQCRVCGLFFTRSNYGRQKYCIEHMRKGSESYSTWQYRIQKAKAQRDKLMDTAQELTIEDIFFTENGYMK